MSALLTQTANRFKTELLQRERTAASQMVDTYGQAWQRIKAQLDALTSQIEQAKTNDVDVSPSWLFQQERYKALLVQTEQEIAQFARYADASIRQQQAEAIHAAQDNAKQLTLTILGDTPEAARLLTSWNRLPVESLQHLVGTLSDGSPLNTLLNQLGPAAAASAKKALTNGVALGMNPRQIARSLRQDAGLQLTRALTIARTEVLRSFRQASLDSYQANDDVVDGWVWTASLSGRTCASCLAMHGTRHSLEEVFGSHPNCRCAPVPITKSWADLGLPEVEDLPDDIETGEDWFAAQDKATQEEVLGPAKYAVYASGRITLADLVAYRDDPQWGPQRSEASLQEALRSGTSRTEQNAQERTRTRRKAA